MFLVSLRVMSLLSYTLRQEMPIDGVVMNYRLELTHPCGIFFFLTLNSNQICEASFSSNSRSVRQRRSGQMGSQSVLEEVGRRLL